ncbi:MAG: class I tRNA ligase family protein [Candidatus Aenigmarchaeota archaeon]|nr:class I tRNA ligase family protein [Candidatus Aenigmarchaeota archaeon]
MNGLKNARAKKKTGRRVSSRKAKKISAEPKRILVTSALPYIHGMPHLGNIVGSVLPADVYSRYLKLAGKNFIYICGSDAHGTSYEVEAFKRGISPARLVDEYHREVQGIFKRYNISFTYYDSTHSAENRELTYRIFSGLDKNRHLEEIESKNPYCEKDKMFLFDRFVEGRCPYCGGLTRGDQCNDCGKPVNAEDIKDSYCVLCKSPVTFKTTKHLYLKLQDFQAWINEWSSGKKWSPLAVGETISWLKKGLQPRRITGDTKWGFPVPKKGYENKQL